MTAQAAGIMATRMPDTATNSDREHARSLFSKPCSAGLGAAYAEQLAWRGHDIIVVARDKARLNETAHRISTGTGRHVPVLSADLSTSDGMRVVEERIENDESVGAVLNNADIALFGPLSLADPAQLDRLLAVNVGAFTRVAAATARAFADRHQGTIINVSSALAVYFLPVSTASSATKSYVLTFTQALAQEFADTQARVQAVVPGVLRTAWWDGSDLERSQLPDDWIMAPKMPPRRWPGWTGASWSPSRRCAITKSGRPTMRLGRRSRRRPHWPLRPRYSS